MLALRDQENLVHAHQTVAAAKPLNQGVKQLQPKTPGTRAPRTPFKIPLNDENNPVAFGKKSVKANGNRTGDVKPVKDRDALVTPLEARQRAPLGMKTTNAKAKGPQTPAHPAETTKRDRSNKRTSTAQRIKKSAPLAQKGQVDVHDKVAKDDVPDIEYMPPKPKELPDIPDEITYDTTFPQFRPKNMALGMESVYGDNEVGSDGLTKKERKFKEDSVEYDKMMDEMTMKQFASVSLSDFDDQRELDELFTGATQKKQPIEERRANTNANANANANQTRPVSNVSTVKSRDAAAALSGAKRSTIRARPASVRLPKTRVTSSVFSSKKDRAPTNPSAMRHSAALASSRTTMGYSKGRSVSSVLHGTASQPKKQTTSRSILSPEKYIELYGPPPLGSEMWTRCKTAGYFDDDSGQDDGNANEGALPTFEEDEEAQNFQLRL